MNCELKLGSQALLKNVRKLRKFAELASKYFEMFKILNLVSKQCFGWSKLTLSSSCSCKPQWLNRMSGWPSIQDNCFSLGLFLLWYWSVQLMVPQANWCAIILSHMVGWWFIDDLYRRPNTIDRDHLVGQLISASPTLRSSCGSGLYYWSHP